MEGDSDHEFTNEMTRTTVEKLQEANVDTAPDIGRYMDSLIDEGGLTPSEARSKALTDLLSHTRSTLAEMLDLTKGTLDGSASKATSRINDARRLHYLTEGYPKRLLTEVEFPAEPPADYHQRFFIMEHAHLQSDTGIDQFLDDQGVDPHDVTPANVPRYCVVTETTAPSQMGYTIAEVEMNEYTADELVEALYEDTYFWTVERATEWRDLLTDLGFDVDSTPEERLNPDVQAE